MSALFLLKKLEKSTLYEHNLQNFELILSFRMCTGCEMKWTRMNIRVSAQKRGILHYVTILTEATASNKLNKWGLMLVGSELCPRISNNTGSEMKKNLGNNSLLLSEMKSL